MEGGVWMVNMPVQTRERGRYLNPGVVCPRCEKGFLQCRAGLSVTALGVFVVVECPDCHVELGLYAISPAAIELTSVCIL